MLGKETFAFVGRRMRRLASKKNTIDLRDPKAREEFLMSEIMKANQKMAEGTYKSSKPYWCHMTSPLLYIGNIEDALPHFVNFIHFSGNPNASLMTLQQSMPAPLFNLIYQAYVAMRLQGAKLATGKKGSTAAATAVAAKKDEPEVD